MLRKCFVAALLALQPLAAMDGWKLVWQDEFDGNRLDASRWEYVTGGNGFGNKELEYYTKRPENVFVRDGMLAIQALKEKYTGEDGVTREFTSGRLQTKGKFAQAYGRFEARIKVPHGQGMWPAFWMLGDGGAHWPDCGEIDIMENIGREPTTVHGTIHGPGYSGAKGIGGPYTLDAGQQFADAFHVYAVEWEPDVLRWYVDDKLYKTTTPADLPSGTRWVYDHPFYLLLNLAIGGSWPGSPVAATKFPQSMLVDYVRVYQREGASGGVPSSATAAIQYSDSRKIWLLTTSRSSYAMGVGQDGKLQHLYWGGPLWRVEDLPPAAAQRDVSSFDPHQMLENEEYAGWGGPRFDEPALKITRQNGDRDLVLRYASHHIDGNRLDIVLKDIRDPIEVTLHYVLYPGAGILSRSATIRNQTRDPLVVESAQSATWYMPPGEGYRLSYLTGRWAAETQLNHEPIHEGTKVLESRTGHTGHNVNPWFAIDPGDAGEQHGRVWFGALAWSGNWRITVEQTPYRQVRVTGGLNTFDFAYPLKAGESLDTPVFYAGFSTDGFGGASRILHRFERQYVAPHGLESRARPVLYNSWEATEFNVNEAGQEQLADKAARLGVELFVMDDGWFGKRNDDHAGLGDWFVNPQKFPNGLKPLIEHVNRLGMDFGLWVEPEMVNPDSDLYRAHPDWAMNFPGRPRSELRNQLVLNMARQDVSDYIFGVLDKLATEYNIRYLKWDMNRIFSEPGWPEQAPEAERKLWVQYVINLYDIIDRLRAKHPQLEIESCSGGGGRIDLGILRRVEEFWTSDNTEAFDRLKIQEGFSEAYAAKFMSAWVTDVPNMNGRSTPLQFRFLVAMQGALGIGSNLNRFSEQDTALATRMVALYKRIRNTVQLGDLYRLLSPRTSDVTANEYVAQDGRQAVLFAFRHSQQYNTPAPTLHLHGLDEKAVYRVEYLDGKTAELSGAYLMRNGLDLTLRGDYDSTAVVLERK